MMELLHSITNDLPDGRPCPPPERDVLWAVVRRAGGCTFWRAIKLLSPIRCHGLRNSLIGSDATEEAVMTRDEVFPSKYLKAADLKGKPRIVTIESAPYEALKGLDGKETQKIVLYFKNVPKGLPLNATSMASATPPAVPIRKIGRDIGSSCTQLEQPWEERRWIASAPVRLLLLGRRQRHRRHRRQSLRVN